MGTCGAINGVPGPAADLLLPGQSVWLTITFRVKPRCPGPLPVQVNVGYRRQGHPVTASLPGFTGLGQVPHSGCAAPSQPKTIFRTPGVPGTEPAKYPKYPA